MMKWRGNICRARGYLLPLPHGVRAHEHPPLLVPGAVPVLLEHRPTALAHSPVLRKSVIIRAE